MINDEPTWARLWNATICGNYCYLGEAGSVPRVDFSNTTLVALFAHVNPSGMMYNPDFINIASVGQTGLGLMIEVRVLHPGSNCEFISFGPSPPRGGGEFLFVAIPKATGHVIFWTHTITMNCPKFCTMLGILCFTRREP